MSRYELIINGKSYTADVDEDMPLLWILRDIAGLTGTKYSCGAGYCGACIVHVNGVPMRACVTPVSQLGTAIITTIEGISPNDSLHPVQQAWLAEQVTQCGYCQSGQIMSAVALLAKNPNPTDQDIDAAMQGNLCRCGTYPRIRKAIHLAAQQIREASALVQVTDPTVKNESPLTEEHHHV